MGVCHRRLVDATSSGSQHSKFQYLGAILKGAFTQASVIGMAITVIIGSSCGYDVQQR